MRGAYLQSAGYVPEVGLATVWINPLSAQSRAFVTHFCDLLDL